MSFDTFLKYCIGLLLIAFGVIVLIALVKWVLL